MRSVERLDQIEMTGYDDLFVLYSPERQVRILLGREAAATLRNAISRWLMDTEEAPAKQERDIV